jgi:hypothetical protein
MDSVTTIINNTARPIPIVLDHPAFRKRKYGFQLRSDQHVTEKRGGGRSFHIVRKAIPGSITLPAHGELKNLHPAICGCAQVRTLEKQGRITVRTESVELQVQPEPVLQPEPVAAPARTRRSRVVAEKEPEQPKENQGE